jgi:thiamine biosynthesis lipoprotein
MKQVGMGEVEFLPDGRVNLHGRALDFGGIAKGYLAEKIAKTIAKNYPHGERFKVVVDCGGDLYVLSTEATEVFVRDPFHTSSYLDSAVVVPPGGFAVVTSGDYERYFEINGRRYSHIINPLTGKPQERITSVTVVAKDGALADAYATAISIGGRGTAEKLSREGEITAALLIYETGERELVGDPSLFVKRDRR